MEARTHCPPLPHRPGLLPGSPPQLWGRLGSRRRPCPGLLYAPESHYWTLPVPKKHEMSFSPPRLKKSTDLSIYSSNHLFISVRTHRHFILSHSHLYAQSFLLPFLMQLTAVWHQAINQQQGSSLVGLAHCSVPWGIFPGPGECFPSYQRL